MSAARLDPALGRALALAREKREQRGATGDGTLVLPRLEPEEAFALDGLLSPRKPILPGRALRIALSQFEAALRECGTEPRCAYEDLDGRPLRDIPAQRAAARLTRERFRQWLAEHQAVRSRPALATWLDEAARQGRVRAEMQPLVEQALAILAALPAPEPVQRTVLAARMLGGDPHGLDAETPLHGLTVSLLAAAAPTGQVGRDASAREVWSAWNVLVDPVSSKVAALNLPLLGRGAVAQLTRAMHGSHVVLTYGQLSAGELRWPAAAQCFSCENPSVLIAAGQALSGACPPLVCTGGHPSDAVRLLLSSLHAAGGRIQHHGDYDGAGVQILRDLQARYGAVPWRFDISSLAQALGRLGRAVPNSRPATLEDAVRQLSGGVAEELVIDELLADLRAAGL